MSRSGYSDDCEGWDLIRWRGAVASAIRGARGQAFLREMLVALDALPEKRLIAGDLALEGNVCALGAVAQHRCLDVSRVDPEDRQQISAAFGIAGALAAEIADHNDRTFLYADGKRTNDLRERDEARFAYVRRWVVENLAALKEG